MKSRKGGYKLVSLQLVELTTMTALAGLYGAIVNSHDKPLLISDIVIDGERKNNVYCRAEKGTNKYTIKNVYGYDIEVTNADAVEVTPNADGIELPVPTPEDDGSIVGVDVQGKYVLKPNPLAESTQADNGKVLEVIDGEWSKGGKKVNVIDAPASTTLTDELIEKIIGGIFINGQFLLGTSPVMFPAHQVGNEYRGLMIHAGSYNEYTFICGYKINITTKIISRDEEHVNIILNNISTINGKELPNYPANTGTFTLKCVDGVLTWVQDQ